ncbi:uncharacterized protein FA14DRAFT_32680 [Meira miltonrushii]|uniref:Uncharacterized protein n=1 Tax=Meira miltonrushii TaxID=1280837 RepID=A0A316VBI8_9BASI|nr:uncharacterized protein FA14DRAFT_32680 [Meira miltonrushii]PWN34664.1 hypothetical protein FA14DRAFT_32680 [Meira miltonrushii]
MYYSRATPKLWRNMLYIRRDDSIRPDISQDLQILSRIKTWSKNVEFNQLAVVLQLNRSAELRASELFLKSLENSGVCDLVLGHDGSSLYATSDLNRRLSTRLCSTLRSLVLSAYYFDRTTAFLLQKLMEGSPVLEILSFSPLSEIYLKARNPSYRTSARLQWHPDDIIEAQKAMRISTKLRALDLLDFWSFECDLHTKEFLLAAVNKLEYLTITFKT